MVVIIIVVEIISLIVAVFAIVVSLSSSHQPVRSLTATVSQYSSLLPVQHRYRALIKQSPVQQCHRVFV